MADDPKPPEPTTEDEPEFASIGDLITAVVGETQKAFAKTLADLLDVGADDSGNTDPKNPKPNDPPAPKTEPITRKRPIF